MRVELNDYKTTCLKEGFKGCLYISNISNQKLKLPKHFDLGYYLLDNQYNKLPYRKNAMYEYALKINLDKRLIKPNDTIKVHFFESLVQLFDYAHCSIVMCINVSHNDVIFK